MMILKLLYDIDIPFTTDGLKRVYVWGNWQYNKCLTTKHDSDNEIYFLKVYLLPKEV